MLLDFQPKRKLLPMSINLMKIGGYRMLCHVVAELRMDRRPKRRKRTCGEALIRASTIPFFNPGTDIAGASAIKTLTCSFNLGLTAKLAKACVVPWEKPIYDSDGCLVVSRIYWIELGISWKANSSIEKFQNRVELGEQLMDFLEYLFPRLFPS